MNKTPFERQHRFVRALAGWDMESQLTETNERTVLALAKQYHLTEYDFKLLDEKPGRYGYDVMIDGKECQWHWKLRQVRNRHNNLFDILEQNESDGYSDDDTTPKISPLFVNERMG